MRAGLLLAFLGMVFLTGYIYLKPHEKGEDTLVIGVFPRRSAQVTNMMYADLVHYLSRKLGVRVRLRTENSFQKFWYGVENREYDLVHFNQYHYLMSHSQFGYDVIAMNEEQNRSTITGMVVVRKDSGINSVADLKGRTILFGGGPRAMQSYIYARYLLEKSGLKSGDYRAIFDTSPLNALVSVFHGLKGASAAGVGDAILGPASKRVDVSQLKILVRGQQHAHLPWAVKYNLSPRMKKRLREVLLGIKKDPKGRLLLKKIKLTNILPATDSDYNPHRRIVKATFGEDH